MVWKQEFHFSIVMFSAHLGKFSKFKENKLLLKNIINKYINFASLDAPKKGFSIPLKRWLNFEMKNTIEKYINEAT